MHPAAESEAELLGKCEVRRTRRGGPGGQHRNKVETAIVLHHRPTDVLAEANERRSQAENLRVAIFRLRVNLAIAVRSVEPPQEQDQELNETPELQGGESNLTADEKTAAEKEASAPKLSATWSGRIRDGKIFVSPQHDDFPTLLADSLDQLAWFRWDVSSVANRLNCSSSQLLKFLAEEPRAFSLVNARRQEVGLRPLRRPG